jgi:hypothetical protein
MGVEMKARNPLSAEMRKAVWAPPASNAGAGWKGGRARSFEDSAAAEDFSGPADSRADEPVPVDRFIAGPRGRKA